MRGKDQTISLGSFFKTRAGKKKVEVAALCYALLSLSAAAATELRVGLLNTYRIV